MQKCNKFEHFIFSRYSAATHLGVVDNVIFCFVGNLTDIPAVKEF